MNRAVLPILLASPALAACGGTSSSRASSADTNGPAVQVTIKSLAFNPGTVHASVGETVVWTNLDGPPHNVTSTGGPKFKASPTLNTGEKFALKLTQAGTITYICSIHPFMKATLVVSN